MFCYDCGEQFEKSDRFTIERKMERSACHHCGHQNPIEAEKCEGCGLDLGSLDAAVVRDAHGRMRLVREKPLSIPARLGFALTQVALLFGAFQVFTTRWKADAGDLARLQQDPYAIASALTLVVGVLVFLSSQTQIDYKARATYAVAAFGLGVASTLMGWDEPLVAGYSGQVVLLWFHNATLAYCLSFLLANQLAGGFLTLAFCMLGFWCFTTSAFPMMDGAGMPAFLAQVAPVGYGIPRFATPAFLAFHLFLPWSILQMLAHGFHQWSEARQMRSDDPTDRVVLRELRRRKLRGVVLNLFVSGVALLVGLIGMHALRKPNALSLLLKILGA